MIAMIVVNGWDFNQMRHVLLALCIVPNLVTIADSASKIVVKRENDKTVSIETREIRVNVLDVMTHRLREPAPRNACDTPTSSAFEIVSGDVVKCVGIVQR